MAYPKEHAQHLLGVGGVIIHDNQVLLVKLNYGGASNFWLIPGGLVEKGETLEEGLLREIKEETNLDIIPNGIVGIRAMVRRSDITTDVYTVFRCDLNSDPEEFKADEDEISDINWFDVDKLQEHRDIPGYTKKIVEVALNSNQMSRDYSFDKQAKERIGVSKYEQYWA